VKPSELNSTLYSQIFLGTGLVYRILICLRNHQDFSQGKGFCTRMRRRAIGLTLTGVKDLEIWGGAINVFNEQGHFILDLGDEFRWFQPSKTKIADAWNGAFSWMHKMSKFRMK